MNEELKIIISAEIANLKSKIATAKKEIQGFKGQVAKASKNVDANMKKAGENIGKAFTVGCKAAAAGIAAVSTATVALATQSIKSFAEYEQLVGGVEKLFDSGYDSVEDYAAAIGKSTDSIKEFQKANGLAVDGIIGPKTMAAIQASYDSLGNVSETVIKNAQDAYKTAGISANTYMSQITSFSASLISSLGGDTAEAARIGDMAIRDMADNANVFGTSIEDIQNAYQGFAKQNYTMLDNLKLGYGGTQEEMIRLIDDANKVKVAMGGAADLTIDSYADVIEAINLVQTEMGITGTTAAEAEKTISGSIGMTKAAWENLMVGLADSNANIPQLVGNVISSATSVLENILPVIKQILLNIPVAIGEISPEAGAAFQTIIDAIMAVLPILQDALQGAFGFVVDTINYIQEHTGLFAGIAAAIMTVVAAIGLYNAVAAVKAAMDAAQVATLGGLIAAKLAVAAATMAALAPYILIVAAIAAVIAIIVLCVKHWDEIKAVIVKYAQIIWEKIKEMVDKVVQWFSDMKEAIAEKIEAVISVVSEKFNAVKETISNAVGAAKDTVVESLQNMKAAYQENGGGIKGIAAATMEGVKGYYRTGYNFIDTLTGGKLSSIVNTIKDKLEQAKQKVADILGNIKQKFVDIWDGVKTTVSNAIDKIKGFFDFEWSLPKLKMPHFSISGEFDLLNIPPKIPKVSVEWYARGGVFDKPTLFNGGGALSGLGERGAEMVAPLETNLEWLDKLAGMLHERMGGNKPIVLTVDGKVFAQTSIDSINQLTRQTGVLGLNLI